MDGMVHIRSLPARQTNGALTVLVHNRGGFQLPCTTFILNLTLTSTPAGWELKMRAWWGCARGDDAMEYMRGASAGSASSSASSGGAQLGYLL